MEFNPLSSTCEEIGLREFFDLREEFFVHTLIPMCQNSRLLLSIERPTLISIGPKRVSGSHASISIGMTLLQGASARRRLHSDSIHIFSRNMNTNR